MSDQHSQIAKMFQKKLCRTAYCVGNVFRLYHSFKVRQATGCLLQKHKKHFTSNQHTDLFHFSNSTSSASSENINQQSTYDEAEVKKFMAMAKSWWDEGGDAVALHTLNRLRIPFIRDGLMQQQPTQTSGPHPLKGFNILDVGCGGGVLAEPLARIGATVHGIDALEETVDTARWHARLDPALASRLSYSCRLVEDIAEEEYQAYDAVICSEIIEHVADPSHFLSVCSQILKPGGSMFITTINKTNISYAVAIGAGEYLFNIVPRGTHDWNKFIAPSDIQSILNSNGLHSQLIHGMCLNPITMKWSWTADTNVNYALHAVKDNK